MPPLSDVERQKLLLQQEIAKISGAISRHASSSNAHQNSYHPYRGYSRGGARGGYSSRARGRGRGGGYSVTMRNTTSSSGSTPGPSYQTASGTATPSAQKEDGEVSPPPDASQTAAEAWVKKTSRGGNMSLMTVQKSNKLAARPPPPPKPKIRVPSHIQVLQSTTDSSPGGTTGKRVVIDGVIFQFEQDGGKLVRIGEVAGGSVSPALSTPTRQSLRFGGESYRRTKRGNLISRSSISQRRAEQANKRCRYFTKTGRCDRAMTCPYKHESDEIAICPRFLRGACPLGDAACPLSHTPSAHNTPSCVHFQATATCRNGDSCLYPHVRVADDAPVCEAFAREGWCDQEAGTCPERHIWECPEWHAKGTCSRGTRCGLRHVLRSKTKAAGEAAATEAKAPQQVQIQGGFDDQSEFIGLPGDVVSETSDSEADDDEEEDGSDDEDDEDDDDDDGDDDETMAVDQPAGKEKNAPSSPGDMDTDDDDELRVMGEV